MFYPELADEYYAIGIKARSGPWFYYTATEVLSALVEAYKARNQEKAKLEFRQLNFPTSTTSIEDYLDAATLVKSGSKVQKGEGNTGIMIDIAGRKIVTYHPSHRYVYDMGELPYYRMLETEAGYFFDVMLGPSETEDELRTYGEQLSELNTPGSGEFNEVTYPALYKKLISKIPTREFCSSRIATELRRAFLGGRITEQKYEVLPILIAVLFIAEPSRNFLSFFGNMLLLDLIEAQIPCPTPSGQTAYYTFENSLWHPDVLQGNYKQRSNRESKQEWTRLGRLGGFSPMAHEKSYLNEFTTGPEEERSYRVDRVHLQQAHVKTFVLICDWLKHLKNKPQIQILSRRAYESIPKNTSVDHIHWRKIISSELLIPLLHQRLNCNHVLLNVPRSPLPDYQLAPAETSYLTSFSNRKPLPRQSKTSKPVTAQASTLRNAIR